MMNVHTTACSAYSTSDTSKTDVKTNITVILRTIRIHAPLYVLIGTKIYNTVPSVPTFLSNNCTKWYIINQKKKTLQ